jgi:hypothetical protein
MLAAWLVLSAASLALAGLDGAAAGDAAAAAGGRPSPSSSGLPIFFFGRFADPHWSGAIELAVSSDGRTVSVNGIAPGPCVDEDFGKLLPGRDGATGPVFYSFKDATIRVDGAFALAERQAGQRRPFKPTRVLNVTGRFSGNTVRGTVRARTITMYDSCTANVAFTARRALH